MLSLTRGLPCLAGGAVLIWGAMKWGSVKGGCYEGGAMKEPPLPASVSKPAVRILLECILVDIVGVNEMKTKMQNLACNPVIFINIVLPTLQTKYMYLISSVLF